MGKTRKIDEQCCPDDEDDGENKRGATNGVDLTSGRFYGWPSSRIVRVSRASGGKDRHSKVLTSKGLRDRRVRLSVNTAIQFYDLQDRLGYDQPSKAVEWLLKAANTSIDELPPINSQLLFQPGDSAEAEHMSSNSENSSIARSESRRIKARARVAAEKDQSSTLNPTSQTTSFTDLLNGINSSTSPVVVNGGGTTNNDFFQKTSGQWCSDYVTSGGLMSNSQSLAIRSVSPAMFSVTGDQQQQQQHFSFGPDHLLNSNNNINSDQYNLNFRSMSSSTSSGNSSGFNRGTLQSNSSPSILPHLQHRSHSPPSFYISTTTMDNHHQFLPGFEHREGGGGKGKN